MLITLIKLLPEVLPVTLLVTLKSILDVNKTFNKVHAVRGVTFGIKPNEVYGLLGPNSAGKV